jgi:hypothetical protein
VNLLKHFLLQVHFKAVDNGGKFTPGVVETSGKLPPVTTTPAVTVANLPSMSLTPVVLVDLRISANFQKNS